MPGALTAPKVLRFDAYEVDLAAGQLHKRGVRISLREKSFLVLASLLEHPGQVVTREELRRRLWREEVFVDFDNNLNTAIARLREALGDSAEHPRFIETLPKHGYRFLANVSKAAPALEPGPVPRVRLVVLPFVNLSGDPAQEYFSDAMTDEIITALASLAAEQLGVIARTTAMHYKGSHKDVARIGRELGVDYVVEGGVHRTDDQVGINVQLIQVSDQTHLFAKKYDAELGEIFGLRDSAAQAIAAHIPPLADQIRAGTVMGGRSQRKPTEDPSAYTLYLQGRYHLHQWTPQGIAKAKRYFEEAIAHDGGFALAYDSLAEVYWWMGFLGLARPKEVFSTGLWAALRAIEIDHTLAQTHALLGMFRKELDYNWPEVQREMALALKLDPGSPETRFRYAGSGLLPQGRIQEAIAELERALESDPLSVAIRFWIAELLYLGRENARAMEQIRLLIELAPDNYLGHFGRGQVRCEEGLFEEAISALRTSIELSGGSPTVLAWLGLALARSGNTAEARGLLERLQAMAAHAYVPPTSFAWIHLGLGDIDSAFTWMERAIDERDPIIIPIKTYPFMDPLRADPRFAALLRKMNLEP